MKRFKEKLNELSNELLHRYKEKAADDARAADKKGNFKHGDKRFSGILKATKKQFDNRKPYGMNEVVNKADVPAYLRKQKGEKPLTMADVKAPRKDSISAKDNLAKARNEEVINEVSSSEVEQHFNNWTNSEHAPYNSDAGDDNKVHQSALRYLRSTNVPKEKHEKMAMHIAHKFHGSGIDEEVKQIDELKKSTVFSWLKKQPVVPEKKPGMTRKDFNKKIKTSSKSWNRALDRLAGYKPTSEETEQIDEKNVPTSPEKWARAKAAAKSKFAVYPSAYANGWASKKYKAMGGGWKSVSEAKEEKPPFDPDPPKKNPVALAGKYGQGYSTAKHLAKMAMQRVKEKKLKETMMGKISN